jgi:glycosyltransferase 2 family protein
MRALRVIWVLSALGFLLYFVVTRWPTVIELTRSLNVWQPILSLILLVAAKLAYTEVVHLTLRALDRKAGFGQAFHAYSVSQIGKYIPGSIWQFVGRYDIYRGYGLHSRHVVELLVLENALMLAVALLVGSTAAIKIGIPILTIVPPLGVAVTGLAAAAAVVAAVLFLPSLAARLGRLAQICWRDRGLVVRVSVMFLAMWILLGLSAYVLFAKQPGVSLPYVVSLFALSYVIGFAVVFAPAGVGVREAVLALGLASVMSPEDALLLAVGHRIVYVASDLFCAGVASLLMANARAQSDDSHRAEPSKDSPRRRRRARH